MFLQSLSHEDGMRPVDGYYGCARMPVRLAPDLAEEAFILPLSKALAASGLGRIAGFDVELDPAGEPSALTVTFSLITDAPRALKYIAAELDRLDAPTGSFIGNAECPELFAFGQSYGLGLYLKSGAADEDGALDVVEACTDALEGRGLYQGTVFLGDRRALYFYGDSFNRMRAAVTFVMSTDPRCRDAYARRLN